MRFKEDIKAVTDLENHAADLLRQVNESRRPVVITEGGRARAVVLDIDSYEALRDATSLLKIAAQGEAGGSGDPGSLAAGFIFARQIGSHRT